MMTPAEAMAKGYTVDSTCSPWVAYKGPRFRPVEWRYVLNDTEADLLAVLKDAVMWVNPDDQGAAEKLAEWRAAIAKAEGQQP